jgi:dihydroxy-acid dehydratase
MERELKSDTVTRGKRMAGARSLLRANGMKEEHFGRPIIAIVNSFSDFVPGHKHLQEVGSIVKEQITNAGYFAPEFNTIAIDDGIAMGHSGMLYSLPSRDLIADSVEYVCNAHCVDAMICISNCDKITPGMLMAAMRLNIPAVFVSGGPMEAGIIGNKKYDLIDVMVAAGNEDFPESELIQLEKNGCPGCGSCAGMFTANSMNCLVEALGLGLPGNGTVVASHINRKKLFEDAARLIVTNTNKYYNDGDTSVLPRSIATLEAFINAMKVDIAMGGSTNTVLHILAIAKEAEVDFKLDDIDNLSKVIPTLCKVSPSSHFRMEDVNKAGGLMAIMGELDRAGLLNTSTLRVDYKCLKEAITDWDIKSPLHKKMAFDMFSSAPSSTGHGYTFGSHDTRYSELDTDRKNGCIRSVENAYSKDGGLVILHGNLATDGCVLKTAGISKDLLVFKGRARVFESQETTVDAIIERSVKKGDVIIIRYEGPKGGPGMQEMLYPTSFLKSVGIDKECALITDGRFSGGTSGLSIGHVSPEAAAGGNIAIIKDGDEILIDIPNRNVSILISDKELDKRHTHEQERGESAYTPLERQRIIPDSLRLYAMHVSSADKGAIRILSERKK